MRPGNANPRGTTSHTLAPTERAASINGSVPGATNTRPAPHTRGATSRCVGSSTSSSASSITRTDCTEARKRRER